MKRLDEHRVIVTERAKTIEPLIREWNSLLDQAFLAIPQGVDECGQERWYTERGLISLMAAAAAWRLNWKTMTEVKTKKCTLTGAEKWNGFVDLLMVQPDGVKLAMEAKLVWIRNLSSIVNVKWALDAACDDANLLPRDLADDFIGLGFVFLDVSGNVGPEELVQKALAAGNEERVDFSAVAVSENNSKYRGGCVFGRYSSYGQGALKSGT